MRQFEIIKLNEKTSQMSSEKNCYPLTCAQNGISTSEIEAFIRYAPSNGEDCTKKNHLNTTETESTSSNSSLDMPPLNFLFVILVMNITAYLTLKSPIWKHFRTKMTKQISFINSTSIIHSMDINEGEYLLP